MDPYKLMNNITMVMFVRETQNGLKVQHLDFM